MARFEPRPKSIVRDMYERAMGFNDFVQYYSLERAEGVFLRYLSDAYKALRHTIPDSAVTDELDDIIAWLGELVRQTDSSLVDEWEKLAAGEDTATIAAEHASIEEEEPPAVTKNLRAFRVMVRNALFRRVELFAEERDRALGALDEWCGWDADRWGTPWTTTSTSTTTSTRTPMRARLAWSAWMRTPPRILACGRFSRASLTPKIILTSVFVPRLIWRHPMRRGTRC